MFSHSKKEEKYLKQLTYTQRIGSIGELGCIYLGNIAFLFFSFLLYYTNTDTEKPNQRMAT